MEIIKKLLSDISLDIKDEELIQKYSEKLNNVSKDEYYLITLECLHSRENRHELFKSVKCPNLTQEEIQIYYKKIIYLIMDQNLITDQNLIFDKTYKKNSVVHIKPFIDFLLESIPLEELTKKHNDKDLFKLTITYKNLWFLPVLKKAGFDLNMIDGESSLYYVLKNGDLRKEIITVLLELGVKPPANLWNYVFSLLIKNTAGLSVDMLDFLKEKGFTSVITNPSNIEGLIKNSLDEKLLPYVLNEINIRNNYGKSPFDIILTDQNKFDWLKFTVDSGIDYLSKDFLGQTAFDKVYTDKNNFSSLIDFLISLDPYHFMKPFFKEVEHKILNLSFYDKLMQANTFEEVSEIEYLYSLFNVRKKNFSNQEIFLFNVIVTTVNHMYEEKEITSVHACLFEYLNLENIIKLYKVRRDFPPQIREALRSYLTCLPNFVENAPKQNDSVYEVHHQNSLNIKELALLPKKGMYENTNLSKAWINWVNFHEEKPDILSRMLKVFNVYSNLSMSDRATDAETISEIKEINSDKESLAEDIHFLFTLESLEKFERNAKIEGYGSQSSKFLSKAKTVDFFHKKLAKASLLLKEIDSFYTRFPHFHKVIKHIESYARLQQNGDGAFYIPPLLMCGDPGVGKTFFANELAKTVSTYFHMFNMESISAGWIFTGLSDSWDKAKPGQIFKTLTDDEQPNLNPIFLLDEIDKAAGSEKYPVSNTLLPLLERFTAKKFKDECIPLEIDASYIVWFATANNIETISAPLKSRFDIFDIPSPNFAEKKELASQVYNAVLKSNTWGHHFNNDLSEETKNLLANVMTAGAARDLRRIITIGCSQAAVENSKELLPHHIQIKLPGKRNVWDEVLEA